VVKVVVVMVVVVVVVVLPSVVVVVVVVVGFVVGEVVGSREESSPQLNMGSRHSAQFLFEDLAEFIIVP